MLTATSASLAATTTTELVSVSSAGVQANGYDTDFPSVSADGRYVAFHSDASNLVGDDTNGAEDIFVHDRKTGETSRVSISSDGSQANDRSVSPKISADGRYVAFYSDASNLVGGDTNGAEDVFVHDRKTGETSRISVSSDGAQGNEFSDAPWISAHGRYVAFASFASNLVAADTNGTTDIFVHDRKTGKTTRASVSSAGAEGNDLSVVGSISADGRYMAFVSAASNLVADDTNAAWDIFVHDRKTGETSRVSVSSAGAQANSGGYGSAHPSISADGRYVAFDSDASNLVAGDTNNSRDTFVHDRKTGETSRVSVSSDGGQGNSGAAGSAWPSISANGRYVAFSSDASNLVPDDTNDAVDIFIRGPLR